MTLDQTPSLSNPAEIKVLARRLGGVPIWGVLPGSPAHQAGMRYGDIVVRVNGVQTPSFFDFLEAQHARGDRLEFEVLRRGVLLRLDVAIGASNGERAQG